MNDQPSGSDFPTEPTPPVTGPPVPPGAVPGQPSWAPPTPGAPPGWGPPAAPPTGAALPDEPEASTSRTGLVIGLVVLVALVVGGVVGAVLVLGGSVEIALDIERCEIAADGTLSASGTITNPDSGSVDVEVDVTFTDVNGGTTVDTDRVELSVPGDAAERWSASGMASDAVDQVNCRVNAG